MTATRGQVQKWREAHPGLDVDEAALMTAGPWPSLSVTDFLAYLSSMGMSGDIVSFIRDQGREMAWAYGGWKKAERDSSADRLLTDMLNNASTVGDDRGQYAFVQRFIRDYARANGIPIRDQAGDAPAPWVTTVDKAA